MESNKENYALNLLLSKPTYNSQSYRESRSHYTKSSVRIPRIRIPWKNLILLLILVISVFWYSQNKDQVTSFQNSLNLKIQQWQQAQAIEAQKQTEKALLAESINSKTQSQNAFNYVNQLRGQNGLQPLTWDEKAYELAVFRSKDMHERSYFDHVTPEGKCAEHYAGQFGINYGNSIAENIYGYEDSYGRSAQANDAIDSWMDSRGHRYALLRPSYLGAAIGCYRSKCTFVGISTENFVCATGAEGLAYWNTVPKQPGEK
ncbi:hypothetical protein HUU53_04010 [Candidatus Micrarchaeota archaeon]|nr:hypothetical protein [Candidatus Micrarchaeota archaeon]